MTLDESTMNLILNLLKFYHHLVRLTASRGLQDFKRCVIEQNTKLGV